MEREARKRLHRAVEAVYAAKPDAALTNDEVMHALVERGAIAAEELRRKTPIGRAGQPHVIARRAVRWHQQSLRHAGLLRQAGGPGRWELTDAGREKLTRPKSGAVLLGVSTELGVALWARAEEAFDGLSEQVALLLTSPPYPIARARAYGGVRPEEYTDFILGLIRPVVRALKPGGHVVLNVGNDVFVPGTPARSTYVERLTIALEDRLGLWLMDRLIWENPSRPPGPYQWASRTRQQLNGSFEFVLWFTNDPVKASSDNRRVLLPHTEQHRQLMERGGERRSAVYGDGAYRLREGVSFANETPGRIPRDILRFSHRCARQQLVKSAASRLGLPAHGAAMPFRLARFLVEFLTEVGELVVDTCGGSLTTADACEDLGRRWVCAEPVGEYLRAGAERLRERAGFEIGADLELAMHERRGAMQVPRQLPLPLPPSVER